MFFLSSFLIFSLRFSQKYMRTLIVDGNFKQDHLKMKYPIDDIPLSDGLGFMVGSKEFDRYTAQLGPETPEVSIL